MSTHRPESPAVRLTRLIEGSDAVEPLAGAIAPVAAALTSRPAVRALLLGGPAGHALHPVLTDLPMGTWMSAGVLDLLGGERARPAARLLVGVGVLSALPTAATGLAEWTHTDTRSGRVGAVHAAGSTIALGFYGLSWLARRREHHGRGAVLGLLGAAAISASGFLGGHLSLARNVASRDAAFADSLPADAVGQDHGAAMLT